MTELTLKDHKFNIGDLVYFVDDFSANPADKVTKIGKVKTISFVEGPGIFVRTTPFIPHFLYNISGHSLIMEEKYLTLYKGKNDKLD